MSPKFLAIALVAVALLGLQSASGRTEPLKSRAWTLRRLGPNSLEKCRAFKRVRRHTQAMQKADGGTLPGPARLRLEAELKHARAMSPASTTALDCGVPL